MTYNGYKKYCHVAAFIVLIHRLRSNIPTFVLFGSTMVRLRKFGTMKMKRRTLAKNVSLENEATCQCTYDSSSFHRCCFALLLRGRRKFSRFAFGSILKKRQNSTYRYTNNTIQTRKITNTSSVQRSEKLLRQSVQKFHFR